MRRRLVLGCSVLVPLACGGAADRGTTSPPPPAVASIRVTPESTALVATEALQFTAVLRDASGNVLTDRPISWAVTDASVATVSNAGLAIALARGTTTISARAEGASATARVTVMDGRVVGAAGGVVSGANGQVSLSIPAGALTSSIPVSVRAVTLSTGDSLLVRGSAYEFGPSGTRFLQPVLLTLRYDAANVSPGVEPSTLGILRSDGGAFAQLEGTVVDTIARTATAPIGGFSSYAIGYVKPAQPDFRLPLPGGFHWLVSTEAGEALPAPLCAATGGVGGRFYGDPNDPDCFHRQSTQFSLDFVPENLETGDLRQSAAGVDILAAADGVIRSVGFSQSLGNLVVIDHPPTAFSTWYAHLKDDASRWGWKANKTIARGEKIGVMGNTGSTSTGAHLHFGVKFNDQGSAAAATLSQVLLDASGSTSGALLRIVDYKVGTAAPYKRYYRSTNAVSTRPVAPSQLAGVRASATSADLSWNDNSANETGFRLERALLGSTSFSVLGSTGPNVTRFSDLTLQSGADYTYRVVAFNSAGDSPASNSIDILSFGTRVAMLQPDASQGVDVWITSVFSYGDDWGVDDEQLQVGGWGDSYHTLLRFDLATLPANATSAVIELFPISRGDQSTPVPMTLHRVTAPWDESVGWFSRPSTIAQVAALSAPQPGTPYQIDITALYNAWKNGTVPNHGVELRPVATNNRFNVFRSSDFAADPSRRPRLTVRY